MYIQYSSSSPVREYSHGIRSSKQCRLCVCVCVVVFCFVQITHATPVEIIKDTQLLQGLISHSITADIAFLNKQTKKKTNQKTQPNLINKSLMCKLFQNKRNYQLRLNKNFKLYIHLKKRCNPN